MNIVHYNPHRRLTSRTNRGPRFFNELFDDFLTPFVMADAPANIGENLNLRVDIYENEDIIIIDAELPGVEKEDISIDVKGKLVTLGGERKKDTEIKEENHYRRERRYGKFERTFSLPFEVNSNTVNATFDKGILKLEIPKPEEQVAKKISIN